MPTVRELRSCPVPFLIGGSSFTRTVAVIMVPDLDTERVSRNTGVPTDVWPISLSALPDCAIAATGSMAVTSAMQMRSSVALMS